MSGINSDDEVIDNAPKRRGARVTGTFTTVDETGKITGTIGTGDNAKNSIVYLTIKWAFIAATIISGFVVLNNWFFRENEKVPDFMSDLETVWKIVIPIITLALGYAFGKHENKVK